MPRVDGALGEACDTQELKALPEVFQIEVTSRCQLSCPMCLRTGSGHAVRDLDSRLLRLMHKRGDFAGSYYTELQFAGEPTLRNVVLLDALLYLRDEVGLSVGMSTNGLTLGNPAVATTCLELDALTVSLDSVVPEVYERFRYPAKFPKLVASLDYFFGRLRAVLESGGVTPFVELQLIRAQRVGGSAAGDVAAAEAFARSRGWLDLCDVRTIGDNFVAMQGGDASVGGFCVNPWTSVSVLGDGRVVSCCYIFAPDASTPNVYGNLWEQSLLEIWEGERVKALRAAHREGRSIGQCAQCYARSPFNCHLNVVSRMMRRHRKIATRRAR